MKKEIKRIIFAGVILALYAAVLSKCFYIITHCGEIRAKHKRATIEEAVEYIEYWELSEDNTVLLYDYDGNVYKWE